MRASLMASASRFAHFSGLSRARATKADDDGDDDGDMKRSKRAGDTDDQTGDDGQKAESDDDGDEARGAKRSKRAGDTDDQTGDDGQKAESGDDDDDPDGDGKRTRRSKRAADDDDDPEKDDDKGEMDGKSAAAAARRRERARCAAIFAHPHAAANAALACSLAFETTMTRQEARKVLSSQPARAPAGGREARNPGIRPAGEGDRNTGAIGASWETAFRKVGAAVADRPVHRH